MFRMARSDALAGWPSEVLAAALRGLRNRPDFQHEANEGDETAKKRSFTADERGLTQMHFASCAGEWNALGFAPPPEDACEQHGCDDVSNSHPVKQTLSGYKFNRSRDHENRQQAREYQSQQVPFN